MYACVRMATSFQEKTPWFQYQDVKLRVCATRIAKLRVQHHKPLKAHDSESGLPVLSGSYNTRLIPSGHPTLFLSHCVWTHPVLLCPCTPDFCERGQSFPGCVPCQQDLGPPSSSAERMTLAPRQLPCIADFSLAIL